VQRLEDETSNANRQHDERYLSYYYDDDGALSFMTPKGNRIFDTPQPMTSDKTLESINQQTGLDINHKTAFPNWHGERMDLDMAVSGLYDLEHQHVME